MSNALNYDKIALNVKSFTAVTYQNTEISCGLQYQQLIKSPVQFTSILSAQCIKAC